MVNVYSPGLTHALSHVSKDSGLLYVPCVTLATSLPVLVFSIFHDVSPGYLSVKTSTLRDFPTHGVGGGEGGEGVGAGVGPLQLTTVARSASELSTRSSKPGDASWAFAFIWATS